MAAGTLQQQGVAHGIGRLYVLLFEPAFDHFQRL
jgi:hypothetical protein